MTVAMQQQIPNFVKYKANVNSDSMTQLACISRQHTEHRVSVQRRDHSKMYNDPHNLVSPLLQLRPISHFGKLHRSYPHPPNDKLPKWPRCSSLRLALQISIAFLLSRQVISLEVHRRLLPEATRWENIHTR